MNHLELALTLAFSPEKVVIARSKSWHYHILVNEIPVCRNKVMDLAQWGHAGGSWSVHLSVGSNMGEIDDWISRYVRGQEWCNHCGRKWEKAVWAYNSLQAGIWEGGDKP